MSNIMKLLINGTFWMLNSFKKDIVYGCFCGEIDLLKSILNSSDAGIKQKGGIALAHAGIGGHIEIVKLLLPHLSEEDIKYQDNYVLREACRNGRVEIVKLLLPYLNREDITSGDCSALFEAIQRRNVKICKLLQSFLRENGLKDNFFTASPPTTPKIF